MKILNSNWIAYPVVLLSAICVALLFLKGKTMPAIILTLLLVVSLLLIIMGQRASRGGKQ